LNAANVSSVGTLPSLTPMSIVSMQQPASTETQSTTADSSGQAQIAESQRIENQAKLDEIDRSLDRLEAKVRRMCR
jgi:hypothetical protein